mgnify:CR=1 FL=1|jgi:importin-7
MQYVAVTTIYAMCRKYEYRDRIGREELVPVIRVIFPKMLRLLKTCSEQMKLAPGDGGWVNGGQQQQIGEFAKAIIKTFWSATYLDLPEPLKNEQDLGMWILAMFEILDAKVPTEAITNGGKTIKLDVEAEETEFKQWPFWKAKKWAQHVTNRLFTRFGNVKLAKEEHKQVAKFFKENFVESLVNINIRTLASNCFGGEQRVPERVVNLSLQFLVSAVHVGVAYKAMKPVLPEIISKVCFPLLCYNKEDDELWQNDPREFVRKNADIVQEMYSPRHAAVNLLTELCRSGKRKTDFFATVVNCAVAVLQANAQVPEIGNRDRSTSDGALFLVGTLSDILKRERGYKESLEQMLVEHVAPAFHSPFGNVRARACWTAAQFAAINFTDKQNFVNLFWAVCNCLKDPELPVKVEAVCSLRAFIDHSEDLETLKPILPQLLEEFFKIMDQVESEDIVYTLETITEKFGEEIAPYAVGMTTNLAAAYWKCVRESEAKLYAEDENEGTGNADYDEDFSAMQSGGCLRAIVTIITSVHALPELYPQIEQILMPIMMRVDNEVDLYEEMLEIIGYISYYGPGISQEMWQIWPKMVSFLTVHKEWALQHFEHVLIPMDNFISRSVDVFVSSNAAKMDTVTLCKMALSPESCSEEESMTAPRLMETVLTNCSGRVDDLLPLYLHLVVDRLIETTPDTRFLQDLLMDVVMHAFIYDVSKTVQVFFTTFANPKALPTVLEKLVGMLECRSENSNKRKHFIRTHDKKVVALGLMALMQCQDAKSLFNHNPQSLMHLTNHLVMLLQDLRAQIEAEATTYNASVENYANEYLEAQAKKEQLGIEDEQELYEQYARHRDDEDFEEEDEVTPQAHYRAALANQHAGILENDEEDFANSDDEEGFAMDDDGTQSPLDDIDTFVTFGLFFQSIQKKVPQLYQMISTQANAEMKNGLSKLFEYSQVRRVEHEQERLKAKLDAPPGHNLV